MVLGGSSLVWLILSSFSVANGFEWEYSGCYGVEDYIVASSTTVDQLTPGKCEDRCKNYRFYGLRNGNICECINSMTGTTTPPTTAAENCAERCTGNMFLFCGGSNHASVKMKSDTYVGCYDAGIISQWILSKQSAIMTFDHCREKCGGSHYKFAAVKNQKCFCGNELSSDNVTESRCNTPCPGHNGVKCGGGNAVSLYYAEGYRGCFASDTSSLSSRSSGTTNEKNFVQRCMWNCRAANKDFTAVSGNECVCAGNFDGVTDRLSPDTCNNPCSGDTGSTCGASGAIDVYDTPQSYFGCVDSDSIQGWKLINSGEMTQMQCRSLCGDEPYTLSGLTQKNGTTECYCDDKFHPAAHVHEDTICDAVCTEGSNKKCGGDDSVTVFASLKVYCTCKTTGDPHYTTFDGVHYNFQGEESYLISEAQQAGSNCNFRLTQMNQAASNRNVSYINNTKLVIRGNNILLQRVNEIRFNGLLVTTFANDTGGISFEKVDDIFWIEDKQCGLKMEWDGKGRFEFHANVERYAGVIGGFCGNCNENAIDDNINGDGVSVETEEDRDNMMGESFQV